MSEMFATGMRMGESPRWHDGRFWMCDWLAGEVLVFDADANREVVARVEGMPFSIDASAAPRLLPNFYGYERAGWRITVEPAGSVQTCRSERAAFASASET
jgi:sugar lactone lactonase YvrE